MDVSYVFMMCLPAERSFTGPFPPGFFAARALAAVILPPLLFFAVLNTSLNCLLTWYSSCRILAWQSARRPSLFPGATKKGPPKYRVGPWQGSVVQLSYFNKNKREQAGFI